jgi:hypothetical protein
MICITKQMWNGQWKLFLDYSQIDVVFYGNEQQVENYFISKSINFEIEESDLLDSGWDYLVDGQCVYFLVDIERDIEKLVTPIFVWHDEVKTIRDLTSYLKCWIRDDKLKKIVL